MVYLLVFLFITIYFYKINIEEKDTKNFVIYFLPVAAILILLLGFQNNVGTDYNSYIELASASPKIERIKSGGELLFYYLLLIARFFNYPQLIFILSAFIKITFLGLIIFELKKLNYKIYQVFICYFLLLLVFFNQFNGIRQYIGVYIIIYAILKLREDKKYLYLLLVIIASLFHKSAIMFLPLVFLGKLLIKRYNKKYLLIALGSVFILSFLDWSYLIDLVVSNIPKYSGYAGSNYIQSMSISGRITKILKLVVVVYCLYKINYEEITDQQRYFINLSYISSFIMILSFLSGLIWRMYQYVDFFLMFPVLIYFQGKLELKGKKIDDKKIIMIYLLAMFIFKVIIAPRGEYLYNSIFFY